MLCGTAAYAGLHVAMTLAGICSVIRGSALVMFCVVFHFIVRIATVVFNRLKSKIYVNNN